MAERSSGEAKKDRIYVAAVGKALRLLEVFSQSSEARSLSELATVAGIEKSSAQRLAHTMRQLDYLELSEAGFLPGRRLLDRSFDYLRTNPLVSKAVPILADLRRTILERVDLSLFDDLSMIYLVRMQSKRESFHAHLVGRRVPTFCTSGGRAVLSLLAGEEALDILQRSDLRKITPRTVTEIDDIRAAIARAKDVGYAFAMEQVQIGELAVAAPLINKAGLPIGAIHVVGSLGEWNPDDFERKVAPLTVAAATAVNSS